MKKCCGCKRVVWPWQQSKMSISSIHLKCHQSIIDNAVETEQDKTMYLLEIKRFEIKTGIKSGLEI